MFKFIFSIRRLAASIPERVNKPWRRVIDIFKLTEQTKMFRESQKTIRDFIASLIQDHEKDFQEEHSKTYNTSKPLLDLVYTLRESMNYEQTIEAVSMLMFGAFETVGKAIPGTLLLLAMNPHEQDKVLAGIKSVLSSENDDFDKEKLGKLVYLDLVMKESLRLIPVSIFQMRVVKKELKLSEGKLNFLTVRKFSCFLLQPITHFPRGHKLCFCYTKFTSTKIHGAKM